jgi:hypothetical protein
MHFSSTIGHDSGSWPVCPSEQTVKPAQQPRSARPEPLHGSGSSSPTWYLDRGAMACDDDWVRQNRDPSAKPPGLEGGLFTGDDLRAEPQAFHIERVQAEKDGSVRVNVKLTHNERGESPWTWRVAAILVRENGHFVVDDVIYLKDSPQDVDVRLSEYLSQGCDGPRWV